VPSIRARVATGVLAVSLPLAGCTDLGDPASAHGVTRNDLLVDLAAQVTAASAHTWTATYQLTGGHTGTVTHMPDPDRTAFRYPGGAVLLSTMATTRCVGNACTMTAPGAAPEALRAASAAGLVPPTTVLALLDAAALQPDPDVVQRDTTIAGRHANCLQLTAPGSAASGPFTTCITTEGVIGSFTGTLDGTKIDVAMTDYTEHAAPSAFAPPSQATMTDRR
jgi:hypothetical protein